MAVAVRHVFGTTNLALNINARYRPTSSLEQCCNTTCSILHNFYSGKLYQISIDINDFLILKLYLSYLNHVFVLDFLYQKIDKVHTTPERAYKKTKLFVKEFK